MPTMMTLLNTTMMVTYRGRRLVLIILTTLCYCSHPFIIPATTLTRNPHSYLRRRMATLQSTLHGQDSTEKTSATDPAKPAFETGTLSPYHVLHPDFFCSAPAPLPDTALPLDGCLRLLQKALRALVENENDTNSLFLDPEIPLSSHNYHRHHRILRIEQPVSHDVDPLCWLRAQTKRNRHLSHQPSAMYFCNSDETFESAIYGSAKSIMNTTHDDTFWDLVQDLPPNTRLYGGQRFDIDSFHIHTSKEWFPFSKGFWMLPAVEIRRREVLLHHHKNETSPFDPSTSTTTIAVHLYQSSKGSNRLGFRDSANNILEILSQLSDASSPKVPPTTLPPILSRTSCYNNYDGQELFEQSVTAALKEMEQQSDTNLEKVVLARRMDLHFDTRAQLDALDILARWKLTDTKPGGYMFYIYPGGRDESAAFFGCTPEKLFSVHNQQVRTEALAGTRPRGPTQQLDEELARELFSSVKDQAENNITGKFIRNHLQDMKSRGQLLLLETVRDQDESADGGPFFVRRLRHLQHICQMYSCAIPQQAESWPIIRELLHRLHPTPAVSGFPQNTSLDFIRQHESIGFDRGFFAGPVGYIGKESAEISVAIRSGLLRREEGHPIVSVYAGAGIVPGSNVQGEWVETTHKLDVVSSIFPQSPVTLQSAPTPNAAWAIAFVEELIRNGVTQFYICPGSRSTPLVVAIARAVRLNGGAIKAISIHDERGAGFRAVGYGRGSGRPAAVITSSGTAVANLYPSIIEASMDGIPLLVITADRPYESRDTGSNQAIDQVKMFSDSYIRWFRDILPPSDDVPVAVALEDAQHGVRVAKQQSGPVHINVQFRENLAPMGGPIRNDERARSWTSYDSQRFTDTPKFQRWSLGGSPWHKSYTHTAGASTDAVASVAHLINESKRGIIVVGNIRKLGTGDLTTDSSQTIEQLSSLAQQIGFPIFASTLSGALRFKSPSVVPFAEHLLRCPIVKNNLQPDLILQFGAPLVSTEIPNIIKKCTTSASFNHVVVHPRHPRERVDSYFTQTEHVDSDIGQFASALLAHFEAHPSRNVGSSLSHMVSLGRQLREQIPQIVDQASKTILNGAEGTSEPEVILGLSKALSKVGCPEQSLFLSNSMPIRDAEAFLYPLTSGGKCALRDIGANRGASGIDGIFASAAGFVDCNNSPTTLLIGDVSALHDLNSLHSLSFKTLSNDTHHSKAGTLTSIVLNNDGGGIFSFLPIASHGETVGFEKFFGTPTSSFSFEKAADAFGVDYKLANDTTSFSDQLSAAFSAGESSLIEINAAPRDKNVLIHQEITRLTDQYISTVISNPEHTSYKQAKTCVKDYTTVRARELGWSREVERNLTLVLLHGWMGDKTDWDIVGHQLAHQIPNNWRILSIDLLGHGEWGEPPVQGVRSSLGVFNDFNIGIQAMAKHVASTLEAFGVTTVDAIAGYSLGGRVALTMIREAALLSANGSQPHLILLSTNPGEIIPGDSNEQRGERLAKDEKIASEILKLSNRAALLVPSASASPQNTILWSSFLRRWYGSPIWGGLNREATIFEQLSLRKSQALAKKGIDLARVLRECSPARGSRDDWLHVKPATTLFIVGSRDNKYSTISADWKRTCPNLNTRTIPGKGHALLVEAPNEIADAISGFLLKDSSQGCGAPKIPNHTAHDHDALLRQSSETTLDQPDTRSTQINTFIASLEYEKFSIPFVVDGSLRQNDGGVGWGRNSESQVAAKQREGYFVQVSLHDGSLVGIGEVSPLPGLHPESIQDAGKQLEEIAGRIADASLQSIPTFDPHKVLQLDGELSKYLERVVDSLGMQRLLNSVHSGLEMAILSLASQLVGDPLHQALADASLPANSIPTTSLMLNGLITRGDSTPASDARIIKFGTWKVKVGHQNACDDTRVISKALMVSHKDRSRTIRADANRSFNMTSAVGFYNALKELNLGASDRIEYIEEPMERVFDVSGQWSLHRQVEELEKWYNCTGIPYALDESILDLAQLHSFNYELMVQDLKNALAGNMSSCAALVLKPSLLGVELSMRLARFTRKDLGISVAFTSSFDTGVGLAFAAFLASLSESSLAKGGTKALAHGLGTFRMLSDDCISPPFASYVDCQGKLDVASLSRAFFGLSFYGMKCLVPEPILPMNSSDSSRTTDHATSSKSNDQLPTSHASEWTESCHAREIPNEREITVQTSLSLPFPADVACTRFTDLPQIARWSPWVSSVAYTDTKNETEWTLRVRGIRVRWRATSSLLQPPRLGIQWRSVGGPKHVGAVEFVPTRNMTCVMNVSISFVKPRIFARLFQGSDSNVANFVRNKVRTPGILSLILSSVGIMCIPLTFLMLDCGKILKWSMEMFRDVVQSDLALEDGNVVLGDAVPTCETGKPHRD